MSKTQPRILLLVDNKWRDLPGDALVACQLERQLGAKVWLEPLGNWKVSVGEIRPHMVIFNHLTDAHLAKYGKWLKSRGVAVVVLPNEGLIYHPEILKFNAGVYFDTEAFDLFLPWNAQHRQAMIDWGKVAPERVQVVGVPRFDFYYPPYTNALGTREEICRELSLDPNKPLLLFNSTFVFARYEGNPEGAEKVFGRWKPYISAFKELPKIVENDIARRTQWLEWLAEVAQKIPNAQIIIKPHPNENQQFYRDAVKASPAFGQNVRIVTKTSIWELINAADVVVTRNCTTAIEGWLRNKPTLDLFLDDKDPFYTESHAAGSDKITTAEELVERIQYYLKGGKIPETLLEHRAQHVRKWCSEYSGRSSSRVVEVLKPLLENVSEPDLKRGLTEYRRIAKRRLKSLLGMTYSERFGDHLYLRLKGVEKLGREDRLARPTDISQWRRRVNKALSSAEATNGKKKNG